MEMTKEMLFYRTVENGNFYVVVERGIFGSLDAGGHLECRYYTNKKESEQKYNAMIWHRNRQASCVPKEERIPEYKHFLFKISGGKYEVLKSQFTPKVSFIS